MIDKKGSSTSKEKLSLGKRLRKSLFVGSNDDVKESFIEYILFPSIRDFIVDTLYNAIDVKMFGKDEGGYRGRRGGRWRGSSGRSSSWADDGPTKYAKEQKSAKESGRSRTSSRYIFENVVFHDTNTMSAIDKADEVREYLLEELYKSKHVTVYDFYDAAELTGEFTDQEWGWKSFGPHNDIPFAPCEDGVCLLLPEPEYLGRR